MKGPLWQYGSIHLVCMYGVLCGDVSWTAFGVYVWRSVWRCKLDCQT